ncbi:MAG: phosphatase PAP2 family protein [Paraprevotella sp.]|nr:phosphatase PAP2 family protein [Paraprevotella sp.]
MDWQALIEWDRQCLLALNGSDSLFWDGVMLAATSTWTWIPVAVLLLYVLLKNNTLREVLMIVLLIALVITLADQFASTVCKPYFRRFRPTQDPELMYLVDVVNNYRGGRYGFISSHAANTFSVCVFLSLLFRRKSMSVTLLLWALLCSYSRIYLGVHYPGDIVCGAASGILIGVAVYYLYVFLKKRWLPSRMPVSSKFTSTGYLVTDLYLVMSGMFLSFVYILIRGAFYA